MDPGSFVNELYKISTYKKIYEPCITPMPSWDMWNPSQVQMPTIIPPKYNKLPGKPRKLKKRNRDDPLARSVGKKHQVSLKCRIYWQWGHNSRTHRKKLRQEMN